MSKAEIPDFSNPRYKKEDYLYGKLLSSSLSPIKILSVLIYFLKTLSFILWCRILNITLLYWKYHISTGFLYLPPAQLGSDQNPLFYLIYMNQ